MEGKFRSNAVQNSPFLEGVPAIAGGVVSAIHGRIFFRKNICDLLPTLPRPRFSRHPFCKKGNSDRERGSAKRLYPALASPATPSLVAGNLDRSMILISRNGIRSKRHYKCETYFSLIILLSMLEFK